MGENICIKSISIISDHCKFTIDYQWKPICYPETLKRGFFIITWGTETTKMSTTITVNLKWKTAHTLLDPSCRNISWKISKCDHFKCFYIIFMATRCHKNLITNLGNLNHHKVCWNHCRFKVEDCTHPFTSKLYK